MSAPNFFNAPAYGSVIPYDAKLVGVQRYREKMEYNHPTYGKQELALVWNDSSSALAVNTACSWEAANSMKAAVAAASDKRGTVAGLVPVAIPDDYIGWIVTKGITLAVSNAAITDGAQIGTLGGAGKVDDDAALTDSELFGRALVAATGADETITVELFGA